MSNNIIETINQWLSDHPQSHAYINAKELAESLGFVIVPYEKKSKGITIEGVNFIFYNEKERLERQHYSIAHELLERHLINENLNQLKLGKITKEELHKIANDYTRYILLPENSFEKNAMKLNYNLFSLKETFITASHELIARRLLDIGNFIITIIDNNNIYLRKSATISIPQNLTALEKKAYELALTTNQYYYIEDYLDDTKQTFLKTHSYPIIEKEFKRVILIGEIE